MVKHIEDFKEEPFFIYFAHNYPHTPYKAGPEFAGSSQDGVRGDIIQELDWGIGEIGGWFARGYGRRDSLSTAPREDGLAFA